MNWNDCKHYASITTKIQKSKTYFIFALQLLRYGLYEFKNRQCFTFVKVVVYFSMVLSYIFQRLICYVKLSN